MSAETATGSGDTIAIAAQPNLVPVDNGQPFTKLHMIQADYGDSLLLEYRDATGQPPKFWLTDGGPPGQKYSYDEVRAAEHLFWTMNTLRPTGSAEEGVPRLERLIVTHPHRDHIVGIDYLLQSLQNRAEDMTSRNPRVLQYSWSKGNVYAAAHAADGNLQDRLPWLNLWYNDKAVMTWNFPLCPGPLDPTTYYPRDEGNWMRDLLRGVVNVQNVETLMNVEFGEQNQTFLNGAKKFIRRLPKYKQTSSEVAVGKIPKANILLPTQNELLDFAQNSGFPADTTYDYQQVRDRNKEPAEEELATVDPPTARNVDRWLGNLDLKASSIGAEKSPANAISIVYEFSNDGKKTLLTGDSMGTIIQREIFKASASYFVQYDILKVPHHGSCYNCLANFPPNTPQTNMNCYKYCRNFFQYFKAKYYCVSSNPFGEHPNPDIYTVSAFVDGYCRWGADGTDEPPLGWKTTNLILVNGVSYNSFKLFRQSAESKIAGGWTFKLWFMPRQRSFCTIDAVTGPDPANLEEIKNDSQFYTYFQTTLNDWYSNQDTNYQIAHPPTNIADALSGLATRSIPEMTTEQRRASVAVPAAANPTSTTKGKNRDYQGTKWNKELDMKPTNANKKRKANGGTPANSANAPKVPKTSTNSSKRSRSKSTPQINNSTQSNLTPPQFPMTPRGGPPSGGGPPPGFSQLAQSATAPGSTFRFPAVVRLSSEEPSTSRVGRLNDVVVQADQGSDFNLISERLATKLGLKVKPISTSGSVHGHVVMKMADGRERCLSLSVTLDLGVENIWRQIYCYVLTEEASNSGDRNSFLTNSVQLLLGIPWLYDVNAVIHVRDFRIEIGDVSKGERLQSIGNHVSFSGEGQTQYGNTQARLVTNGTLAPMVGQVFAAESVGEGASDGTFELPPASPTPTSLEEIWHDFDISKFKSADLPDWKYFNEDETPPTASSVEPPPGQQAFVGLSEFVDLLQKDNALPPASGYPKLSDGYFNMLQSWLPSPGLYPNGADAVLGVLLSAFFDSDVAAQILTALPLNPNGPGCFLDTLQASPTSAAITLLPVHNLRFEVVAPNPETGSRLFVLAIYFALQTGGANMPLPVIGTALNPVDVMTWRVPFANATYPQGSINFVHNVDKGIQVKLVWPFYQNRTMIAHFGSQMNINRNPLRPISIPCKGTAFKKMDQPASYDIKFGDMDLLDIFGYLYPSNDKFSSVFGKHFENLGIQRLVDVANTAVHMKAKDVGLVFRQGISFINSVTLEDVYGTLSFEDSLISLDLPGSPLTLPISALPALTIRLGDLTQPGAQRVNIAVTKTLSDLGFVALEGSFSRSKLRPELNATLMCNPGVSLGELVEGGLGLVSANCLDSDFLKTIHLGSLSAKSVTDGVMDALDKIFVPYARVQVGKLQSGSFGVTELEVQLELDTIALPEEDPVIALRDFQVRVLQQRSGAPLPQGSTSSSALKDPPSSDAITSVNGSATVMLGGIDANVDFVYDPTTDADIARMGLTPPQTPAQGRQLLLDLSFPQYHPTLGDLIDQIIGEAGKLAGDGGGTFKAKLPSALHEVLEIAALQECQVTLSSDAQENAPWRLASIYVVIDLVGLIDLLGDIFDEDLPLEWPKLAVRVNDPTTPASRTFDIQLSSIINIAGSNCTIFADISKDASSKDVISFSYSWDPASMALTLGRLVESLSDSISDEKLGEANSQSYINALRDYVPKNLVSLIDDINIEDVRIVAADFSTDNTKSSFGIAEIFVQIADAGVPWAPFGDAWSHLTFANTRLGYSYTSGRALAGPTNPTAKGSTQVTFGTLMQMKSLSLNIIFNFNKTATTTSFTISLTNVGSQNLTLVDLIASLVDDIGINSMAFPEDAAKKLFDIDLASLSITYSKTIAPAQLSESISVQQAGGATFLGVTVSSISIVCDKSTGSWGYSLQVLLPPTVKPFAKVLPVPGVEDFTVVNGFFGMFKGPVVPPSNIAPMMPSTGADGLSIFLSGGLKFEGNDFLNLCGTILKIPQVDFAVQSGGTLSIAIPVGKLELIVADHPMFSVEKFQLLISQGSFMLSAELDLLCEWLAPSIKDSPIGFRFSLGVGVGGSLNLSIYSVDPKTGMVYPDMSTFPFIKRPFWIPGLVLYPFHFSMRWLAAAPAPEALAAGGGFCIEGTPMTNVFAFSLDRVKPTLNYVECDIEELTISQIFGRLVPNDEENERIFSIFNAGFKVLKININPGQKQFHIYADFYLFFLHGKAIADVDPTAGLAAAVKIDPIDLGNGLIQLISYNSGPTVGPFVHLNTNVRDIVAGKVPQNPQTPEWAGMTSGDPKLDNSIFALTAKLVFLGFEFDIFGLLDQTGLLLYTYMGLNVALTGVKLAASRQMSVAVTSTMFTASFGFKFDLEIDVPPSVTMGVPLGKLSAIKVADLELSISLEIKYDTNGWMNDGFVFEASFHLEILGLVIDVPHMRLEITLKGLSEIPDAIENFVRDKVIDELKDKLLKPVEEAAEKVKEVAEEAVDTMVDGFNMEEREVGHALTEAGQEAKALASTLKDDLGMGLDETVNVFKGLGKDISDFGEDLANVFSVPKFTVAEAAVEQGLCSVEHALEAGLKIGINDLENIDHGLVGLAQDLGNIGNKALDELEEKAKEAQQELNKVGDKIADTVDKAKDEFKKVGVEIGDAANKAKQDIEDAAKTAKDNLTKIGDKIVYNVDKAKDKIDEKAKEAAQQIEDEAKNVGNKIDTVVDKAKDEVESGLHKAKEEFDSVAKSLKKYLPPW